MSGGYTPGGKGHWILNQLAQAPRSRPELLDEVRAQGRSARKYRYVISALQHEGMIYHHNGVYALLPAGEALRERLDIGTPTVRIFREARAA